MRNRERLDSCVWTIRNREDLVPHRALHVPPGYGIGELLVDHHRGSNRSHAAVRFLASAPDFPLRPGMGDTCCVNNRLAFVRFEKGPSSATCPDIGRQPRGTCSGNDSTRCSLLCRGNVPLLHLRIVRRILHSMADLRDNSIFSAICISPAPVARDQDAPCRQGAVFTALCESIPALSKFGKSSRGFAPAGIHILHPVVGERDTYRIPCRHLHGTCCIHLPDPRIPCGKILSVKAQLSDIQLPRDSSALLLYAALFSLLPLPLTVAGKSP